jgi:hypothetical protein
VLKTSAGLILFDSTETEAQARDHLVPGLRALGLDPATIRTRPRPACNGNFQPALRGRVDHPVFEQASRKVGA